jgi:hypothetical protein
VCWAAGGPRHRQNRIRAQTTLIRGAVQFNHEAIQRRLLPGIFAQQRRGDFAVDVAGGLQRAFAQIARFVAVSQFHSFLFAGGCAGRHSGPSHASISEINIRFHRRIPTGIEDLTSYNLYDIRHSIAP